MNVIAFRTIALYLVLVITVATVWGLTVTPSLADEPPPTQYPGGEGQAEPDADLQPYSSSSALGATQVENPYVCKGQTDYPLPF